MSKKNEELACEAARLALERVWAGPITETQRPEETERAKGAVEVLFNTPVGVVPMEHTLIETYPGQIEDEVRAKQLLGGLEGRSEDLLSNPGSYSLLVEARGLEGITDVRAARQGIERWIRNKARDLGLPFRFPEETWSVNGTPPAFPSRVTLQRREPWKSQDQKDMKVVIVVSDVESLRRRRIREAFRRKCPKLARARSNGAPSVLVLEWREIFLTSDHHVSDAVYDVIESLRQEASVADLPTHIFLVGTALVPWRVWLIVEDGQFTPFPKNRRFKFDPVERKIEESANRRD